MAATALSRIEDESSDVFETSDVTIDGLLSGTAVEVQAASSRQHQARLSQAKVRIWGKWCFLCYLCISPLSIFIQASSASAVMSRMPLAGQASSGPSTVGQHEWAVQGSIPNLDDRWAELQPTMALRFPFELDVVQKEAICHMEVMCAPLSLMCSRKKQYVTWR